MKSAVICAVGRSISELAVESRYTRLVCCPPTVSYLVSRPIKSERIISRSALPVNNFPDDLILELPTNLL